MVSKEEVLAALRECYDPEIPVNIVDLGLVYDVQIKNDEVHVKMTLTAPGCPMHSTITQNVRQKIEQIKGVRRAAVEIVWEPEWTPERMSLDAKRQLGMQA